MNDFYFSFVEGAMSKTGVPLTGRYVVIEATDASIARQILEQFVSSSLIVKCKPTKVVTMRASKLRITLHELEKEI